jgi:peptidyl-tRNA hydrolase, PTH1 family
MRFLRRGDQASTLDLLVAGLGNPGRTYERTRHNAGWMVVDELARRHDGSFRSKFDGQLSEIRLAGLRLALLKPETYMNVSGKSISAAQRFFKVDPASLLIVHDDVDLEPGRLQARSGGGLAGHNGLRSLKQHLHSDAFLRVRIGVGKPPSKERGADHVLRRVSKKERAELDVVVQEAADAVEMLVADGVAAAMTTYNAR